MLGEEIGKQLLALRKNKVSKALAPNLVASLQVVQDLNTAQTLLSLILQNTYEVQLPIIANRIVEDVATVNLESKLKSLSKKSVKKKIKKIGKVKITKKAGIDLIRDPVTGEMRPPRRSDFDASNVSPQDGSDQRQLQEVRIKIFEKSNPSVFATFDITGNTETGLFGSDGDGNGLAGTSITGGTYYNTLDINPNTGLHSGEAIVFQSFSGAGPETGVQYYAGGTGVHSIGDDISGNASTDIFTKTNHGL